MVDRKQKIKEYTKELERIGNNLGRDDIISFVQNIKYELGQDMDFDGYHALNQLSKGNPKDLYGFIVRNSSKEQINEIVRLLVTRGHVSSFPKK